MDVTNSGQRVTLNDTGARSTTSRITARSDDSASDYTELARLVREAGLMRRRYGYYWTKLCAVPVVCACGIAAFLLVGDSWWQLVVAAAFGIMFTQIAFLGHDAAHRQIFRSGKWNDWISLILGGLFIGMSYSWWQHKHTRHHANPNKIGSDPDVDLPVVSFTPEQAARRRGLFARWIFARWIIANQGVFFFPILTLEGLSLHASSVRHMFAHGHIDHRWAEITFILFRLVGFLTLVFLVLPPGIAFAFLGVQLGLFGFYMGMSFAPNHKGMPLVPPRLRLDFLRRQVMMSRNIRGNPALDIAMGGLNYQIEHHLFPSMARPRLRHAAPIIRAYCTAHGVTYTQTGLFESYGIVLHYINRVGLGERDPFECPLLAARQQGMIETAKAPER